MRAQSEKEVLRQAVKHAQTQHGVKVTPELVTQVHNHIRDEYTEEGIPPVDP
jgi:predicted small metal-binding protein